MVLKKHTKFVHVDTNIDDIPVDSVADRGSPVPDNVVNTSNTNASGTNVYLPIVQMLVNGKRINALLDKGSTNTFITESLASSLNLKGNDFKYVLNTVSHARNASSKLVTYREVLNNVLVVSNIPAKYPCDNLNVQRYPHLENIPISPVKSGDVVDVLIGMDNSHLLVPLDVRFNPSSLKEPHATKHVFGWVLNGIVGDCGTRNIFSHFVGLDDKIDNMWGLEYQHCDSKGFSVEDI